MGRKLNRTPRLTRREKLLQERLEAKASQELRSEGQPPTASKGFVVEAKNPNQRTALRLLNEGKAIIFLTGSAGTGKSLLACSRAANLLRSKRIEKIYLCRPAVGVGKSVGLLPGEIKDKLGPYFKQTIIHLERFLGKGYTKYCLDKEIIEMQPAEYLRGMSLENCFVLVEEAQNFDHEDMECAITRLGENCQMVFTGDTKQNDLKVQSGLKTTVELIEHTLQTHPNFMDREDMDALDDDIGIVKFQPADVVRHGLTRAFVKLYYHTS